MVPPFLTMAIAENVYTNILKPYGELRKWTPMTSTSQDHAQNFDKHISESIPGLNTLEEQCVTLSKRFVQEGSMVVDVGCSTGLLLSKIERHNSARRDVKYIGLDTEFQIQRSVGIATQTQPQL